MDNTLEGVERAESYVDDCCVFSKYFEEHLKDLKITFDRMRRANVRLRRDKCHFGYKEGVFLGHNVSAEGRKPLQSTVEKLRYFPEPKSGGELLRFLGSLNFYRSYIPRLAQIAVPLYKLTQKHAVWNWSGECERALHGFRTKLVQEPVLLAFPRWDKEFYIKADAISQGVAAVLSQEDRKSGNLKPVCYFSSVLSASQENYSAGQLEAWALVAATRKWGIYLKATQKVFLLTDHNPLKWLRNQRDPRHTPSHAG